MYPRHHKAKLEMSKFVAEKGLLQGHDQIRGGWGRQGGGVHAQKTQISQLFFKEEFYRQNLRGGLQGV